MFRFTTTAPLMRIVAALLASVLLATIVLSPAAAYQPVPTNHLVSMHLNPYAMAQAGQPSELGDPVPTRYLLVTATGLSYGTTVTFEILGGLDSTGQPYTVKRTAKLYNATPVVLDFGQTVNPLGDGMLLADWSPVTTVHDISLDIWSGMAVSTH